MCNPAVIPIAIAGVQFAVQGTQAAMEHLGQQQAQSENDVAADQAAVVQNQQLSLNMTQQQDEAMLTIMAADRQARQADALARVSAGESGVAGASVDALLGSIEQERADFSAGVQRNLDNTLAQSRMDRLGVAAQRDARKKGIAAPNPWATSLKVGGAGLDAANSIYSNLPKSVGSGGGTT